VDITEAIEVCKSKGFLLIQGVKMDDHPQVYCLRAISVVSKASIFNLYAFTLDELMRLSEGKMDSMLDAISFILTFTVVGTYSEAGEVISDVRRVVRSFTQ
jgi:hypothetical protein